MKRKGPYDPTLHRDGTVTYWSVYRQVWIERAASIPDEEYAAMGTPGAWTVLSHVLRGKRVRRRANEEYAARQ